jgi:hypothetical protein
MKGIITKQKSALRIINQAKYNAHTEGLFKKSKILPFNLLADYFKLQFIHRFVHKHLPSSLSGSWLTNEERRNPVNLQVDQIRQLRNQDDLYVPFSRLASTEKPPLASFPKLWNEFDNFGLKINPNKISFNVGLKKMFFDSLADNYVCNRLLCPHCHLP